MKLWCLLFIMIISFPLLGQDLQHIAKEKPFKINGSISFNNNINYNPKQYGSVGYLNNYSLNANTTFNIYGISIPFTAMYNKRSGFQYFQPFQQYGMSPTYKWIKMHVGHRNITLSNLSLSGVTFLGGAIELTPKWFRFSAMYGNLKPFLVKDIKAGNYNATDLKFRRIGYGAKLGFGTTKNFVDIVLFKAKDQIIQALDSNDMKRRQPAENTVAGLSTRFTFFKKMVLTTEVDGSAYTENTNVAAYPETVTKKIPKSILDIISPRLNTQFNYAMTSNLQMNFGKVNGSINFRRMMPEFRSMGTNFKGGDQQSISSFFNFSLLGGKLNLSTMLGQNQNNLLKRMARTNVNTNGMLQCNLVASKHFNIGASYSLLNMQAVANKIAITDSSKFLQQSHTITFTPTLTFKKENITHSIGLTATGVAYDDKNKYTEIYSDNKNLQCTINYAKANTPKKRTLTLSLNGGILQNFTNTSNNVGAGIAYNTPIKSNKITSNSSYNFGTQNSLYNKKWEYANHIFKTMINAQAGKHHGFYVSASYNLQHSLKNISIINRQEFIGSLGYTFRF